MKFCFLDINSFKYSFKDLNNKKLRGGEAVFINLSKEVSNNGHQVHVYNNCEAEYSNNNYFWSNINKLLSNKINFDVVVSNGDCNAFKLVSANKNILISHSNQPIEQFIRKRQTFSYLKYKPKICFSSNYQKKKRSKLISLFGDMVIPWSVDDIFLNEKISNNVNNNQAIFTSRPDRNQKMLINIWSKLIYKENNSLNLLIYGNSEITSHKGISNKNLVNQSELIKDLKETRIFLIPGHRAETFCLSAEEARELCIPIITLGIGCLKERVVHGETGFIASNEKEFANLTLDLFRNDNLWSTFRKNLINIRGKYNWFKAAKNFISQIYK
tara:strand:- start:634 stop:1617 length:984 start_codon:yes stop_codon:yes gene_type:complete